MLHSIAVTTDFSEPSRESLAVAAALARKFGARLQVVHVAPGAVHATPGADHGSLAGRIEDFARSSPGLERHDEGGSAGSGAGVVAEPRVLRGDPAGALRRFQESDGVDLIVVASHGNGDVRRFLLGSIATRVVRSVTCSVLVFRAPGWAGAQAGSAAGSAFAPRRILVPHDFSPTSSEALETARAWALAFGSTVRLLHVTAGPGGEPDGARSRLREILGRDWEGIPAVPVTCAGSPPEGILREAEELRADLIVLASHGVTGAGGRPLGSVAERVLHGARCPVLVVKRRTRGSLRQTGAN